MTAATRSNPPHRLRPRPARHRLRHARAPGDRRRRAAGLRRPGDARVHRRGDRRWDRRRRDVSPRRRSARSGRRAGSTSCSSVSWASAGRPDRPLRILASRSRGEARRRPWGTTAAAFRWAARARRPQALGPARRLRSTRSCGSGWLSYVTRGLEGNSSSTTRTCPTFPPRSRRAASTATRTSRKVCAARSRKRPAWTEIEIVREAGGRPEDFERSSTAPTDTPEPCVPCDRTSPPTARTRGKQSGHRNGHGFRTRLMPAVG